MKAITTRVGGRRNAGTSLVEVLVVIVIFLVGILAIAQVFPGGFRVLNQSRDTAIATQLAQAERDRLLGLERSIPGDVVSARTIVDRFVPVIEADTERRLGDYGLLGTALTNEGMVNAPGGNRYWPYASGPNNTRRIVGERALLSPPRPTYGLFATPIQLLFAPLDPNGRVTVGGLHLERRIGVPGSFATAASGRPHFYVNREGTLLYVPRRSIRRVYGLRMAFRNGDQASNVIDAEVAVLSGTGYAEVDLALYGPSGGTFRASPGSVQLVGGFTQLAAGAPFSSDPYEFKVVDVVLGRIALNPLAYDAIAAESEDPTRIDVNYDVFDWRILRDDFRVAEQIPARQKTRMRSLKVLGNPGPDGRPYGGLGFSVPARDGTPIATDVAIVDMESGRFLLPGTYVVDKSIGLITFYDEDASRAGLQGRVWDAVGGQTVIDLGGRRVRALYEVVGEWAVHFSKSADAYVATDGRPSLGEFLVGGPLSGLGRPTRLYFARSELGKTVVVGECWYRDSANNLRRLSGQSFVIRESSSDILPYLDIAEAAPDAVGFDTDLTYGYVAREVRGGSMRILVSRNAESFHLSNDSAENVRTFEAWGRNWRRTASETFVGGDR
ncbi:MAG: hypothetical protein KIS66_17420 [Fimbriimonadaceae bacterium]|nr:hypothetical protein [Fimbriimonadaceae bacterium]